MSLDIHITRNLSQRQAFLIWILVLVMSIGIVIFDCRVYGTCSLPLLFSLLSISHGFIGTIILALPSLFMKLGESQEIKEAKEFNRKMKSAYNRIENDEDIEEGEEEFDSMMTFIQEHSDYEGEPSMISKGNPSGALYHYIAIDGNDIDIKTINIRNEMKSYMNRVREAEEWEEEVQEQTYVLLGCGIYGLAIIFQSISTIAPNINI